MFQHLIRAGLHQTHRAFRSECSALNIPIQSVSPPDEINTAGDRKPLVSETTVLKLLNAFDDVDLDLFFKVIHYSFIQITPKSNLISSRLCNFCI